MPKTTESTSFTKDVQGRYLCNDITEVNTWKSGGGRPFDILVIGGGTFGAVIAEHLWFQQKQRGLGLRTLVIDAGKFTIPEHTQNTGILGFTEPPEPLRLNEAAPQPEPLRYEVWGIPWKSETETAFKGLAYTLGGRSLYWGGWSPRPLDEEMETWPPKTVADLTAHYFDESSRQIGVDETNDFIFGKLHSALRRRLFDKLGMVGSAIPLDTLPASPLLNSNRSLAQLLGPHFIDDLSGDQPKNMLQLEAPLGVQARPPHAGFFPLNKFSTVPLLMKASRAAATKPDTTDATKEFMVLPGTHVISLKTEPTADGTRRVTGANTSAGFIDLAPGGVAVIALGTIESARLAQLSFDGTDLPTFPLMGENLTAHLRSNLMFRIPRDAIPGLSSRSDQPNELQTSALFVKCRAKSDDGQLLGRFHLQISASGGGSKVGAEDELFKKIPDVDFFDHLRTSTDTHVAIVIRGVGEMESADPADPANHPSRVKLNSAVDEFKVRRAMVTLKPTERDKILWKAMDNAMQEVANLFANGGPMEDIQFKQDGLGTTHHEAGTLWMGTDPKRSVTNEDGRFHHTENLYAAGPCLFPSSGSPAPMLTGIALARRTGDCIIKAMSR